MKKLYVTVTMQEFTDGDNVFGQQLLELRNVETAAYNQIEVFDTLDYLSYIDRQQTLRLLISKLRHGGVMTILGSDLNMLAMSYFLKNITEEEFNVAVFNGKQSSSTNEKVLSVCKEYGLKVIRNRIYDYKWQITVERP